MEKYLLNSIENLHTIIANALGPKLPTLPPASSVADLPSVDALTQNAHSSSNPGNLKWSRVTPVAECFRKKKNDDETMRISKMFQDHWWVIWPKSSYKSAWNLAGPPQWILGTNHRNPCTWKQDGSWSKATIVERMIFAQKAKDLITESFTLCFCCSECILSFTYSCQSCHATKRCQNRALILGSNNACIMLLWEPLPHQHLFVLPLAGALSVLWTWPNIVSVPGKTVTGSLFCHHPSSLLAKLQDSWKTILWLTSWHWHDTKTLRIVSA